MSQVAFVTSKPEKAAEVSAILGARLEHVALDIDEIQSSELDLAQIVRRKATDAFIRHGKPVLVEDVGLYVNAMGGFPGPYARSWGKAVGYAHAVKVAVSMGERGAAASCAVEYFDGACRISAFGSVHGILVPKRGDSDFGFDPYFQPDGFHQTFAEMGVDRKNRCSHRFHAWTSMGMKLRAQAII